MAKYIPAAMTVSYNVSAHAANFLVEIALDENADVAESTGAGDAWKTFGVTVKSATAKVRIYDDSAKTVIQDIWAVGTSAALSIDPGAATYTKAATALVTRIGNVFTFNEFAVVEADLQITGAVTTA